MTDNFDWFKDNGIYMPMINDTGRNIFYKAAIEAAVPGKVVCDIGTGSGLLSIIAAKAGATKVYAVEMDPGRAAFAEDMFARLGLTNIEVVKGDFLNTDIRADIFVSETIGSQVFNENIIAGGWLVLSLSRLPCLAGFAKPTLRADRCDLRRTQHAAPPAQGLPG